MNERERENDEPKKKRNGEMILYANRRRTMACVRIALERAWFRESKRARGIVHEKSRTGMMKKKKKVGKREEDVKEDAATTTTTTI